VKNQFSSSVASRYWKLTVMVVIIISDIKLIILTILCSQMCHSYKQQIRGNIRMWLWQ